MDGGAVAEANGKIGDFEEGSGVHDDAMVAEIDRMGVASV
jgi:hypothetical protein